METINKKEKTPKSLLKNGYTAKVRNNNWFVYIEVGKHKILFDDKSWLRLDDYDDNLNMYNRDENIFDVIEIRKPKEGISSFGYSFVGPALQTGFYDTKEENNYMKTVTKLVWKEEDNG